jgi:hypothetical protein
MLITLDAPICYRIRMSFGDNLGVAGVILALLALAVPYLWPNQKWIGWAAITFAAVSIAGWAFLAFGSLLGVVVAELILLVVTLMLLWLLSKSKGNGTPALEATASNADYPPGTRLGNLEWSPRFADLRFIIRNPTGADLDDIDIVLLPDVAIASTDQITQLPDVSCSPLSDDVTLNMEFVDGKTGKRTVVPLVMIASTQGYRVQCKKLPRKQRLELLLAAAAIPEFGPPKVQKPITAVFDRDYAAKIGGKNERGAFSIWYGHGRDSNGLIEEVYSPQRPIPKVIQVEGTCKMMARQLELSQHLQVHDFIDEFLPKIREHIQRGAQ